MREIPLTGRGGNHVALVDDKDYDRVMTVGPWYAWKHPVSKTLYARRNKDIRSQECLMHKFITCYELTDHKDHNGLNNQRANLREVTHSQNHQNQPSGATGASRYKGVCWHKQMGKWRAYIVLNYKQRSLGLYTNETEAALAYDRAAREMFGEYACLNFPDLAEELLEGASDATQR